MFLLNIHPSTAVTIPYTHDHACANNDCSENKPTKKNIIMMVSDGTGASSFNLGRYVRQYRDGLNNTDILEIENFFGGLSRTRSSSSWVTDSAAGATAFACGHKTYNNGISITADKKPVASILEALKLEGWTTGLVVTTGITDATPAAYNSHAEYRKYQAYIAQQQLGLNNTLGVVTDLMMGGGRCYYVPQNSEEFESCREDDVDLLAYAKEIGFNVASTKAEYDALNQGQNTSLPLLALLADFNYPYAIDREETQVPTQAHQAKTALHLLDEATKDKEQGFFLMLEGSRIDHGGHANDAPSHAHEVLAYNDMFLEVLDYVQNTDTETIIISTSDHECGGLTLGLQTPDEEDGDAFYGWYPEVLLAAKKSGEYLAKQLVEFNSTSDEELKQFVNTAIFQAGLGINNATDDEIAKVIAKKDDAEVTINHVLDNRAHIGWTSTGHTGADVNIFTYANKLDAQQLLNDYLMQNVENTEIARFLEIYTGTNLTAVSEKLEGIVIKP
ncbi:unnamed protein product [Ambrosiozyma monospora]|uniref:Unnamed protein product n=1 Tax=Ambrosiozyma monospora TaxID=43982 RepID=A0ACB5T5H6_AMBMO|nr:unnamed protein product [Ambrosiozyma monospora]